MDVHLISFSLWRSFAVQGSRRNVEQLVHAGLPFRLIYEEETKVAARSVTGGWPHFISYVCIWLTTMG
jgi:hypothetical protein